MREGKEPPEAEGDSLESERAEEVELALQSASVHQPIPLEDIIEEEEEIDREAVIQEIKVLTLSCPPK